MKEKKVNIRKMRKVVAGVILIVIHSARTPVIMFANEIYAQKSINEKRLCEVR